MMQCVFHTLSSLHSWKVLGTLLSLSFLQLVGGVFCEALVGFAQAPKLKYMQYKTLIHFVTYVFLEMRGARGVGKVLRF